MKKIILLSVLFSAFAGPVLAAGLVPCGGQNEPACNICYAFVMFKNVIDFFVFTVVPPVAVLMAAIAGFLFIVGAGFDPGLILKAKSIFKTLLLGLALIFGSWILVNSFFVFIGAATLQGTWFIINCAP